MKNKFEYRVINNAPNTVDFSCQSDALVSSLMLIGILLPDPSISFKHQLIEANFSIGGKYLKRTKDKA